MIIKTAYKETENLDLLCNTLNAEGGRFLYTDKHLYHVFCRAQAAICSLEEMVTKQEGKWICICSTQYWQYNSEHYQCSVCNSKREYKSAYCPSCGAKMSDEKGAK